MGEPCSLLGCRVGFAISVKTVILNVLGMCVLHLRMMYLWLKVLLAKVTYTLKGGFCSFVTTVILRYLIFPHVFWHWYRLLDRLFPGAAVKNVVSGDVGDHFHGTSSDLKSSKNVVHGDPPDPER